MKMKKYQNVQTLVIVTQGCGTPSDHLKQSKNFIKCAGMESNKILLNSGRPKLYDIVNIKAALC